VQRVALHFVVWLFQLAAYVFDVLGETLSFRVLCVYKHIEMDCPVQREKLG